MTAATRAKATRGERTRRCGAAKSVGVVMSRKTPSIVPKSWKLRRRLYHVRHAGDLEPPREDPPPAGLGPRPGDDHADPRRSRSSRDRPHPRRRPPAGLQRALERAGHPAVDGLVPPPPPARGRDHARTGAGHAAPDLAAAGRARRALPRPARRADAVAATYRTRTTTALGGPAVAVRRNITGAAGRDSGRRRCSVPASRVQRLLRRSLVLCRPARPRRTQEIQHQPIPPGGR